MTKVKSLTPFHEEYLADTVARIKQIEPKLVCFGHIHENGGQTVEIDGTIYVNAAILNEDYEIANKPVIVELEY